MIYDSHFGSIEIPNIDIPSYVFRCIKERKDCEGTSALIDGHTGNSLTPQQVETMSWEFGSGLVNNYGFGIDDRLLMFIPNTIYFPIIALGTLMAGGIVSTANPSYKSSELAHQIVDTECKHIVTTTELIEVVLSAIEISNICVPNRNIIIVDTNESKEFMPLQHVFSRKPFIPFTINSEKEANSKIAFLCYSSGTTGLPKGVMLSHKGICSSLCQNRNFSDNSNWFNDPNKMYRYLGAVPFYHIFGLVVVLFNGLAKGVGIVVLTKFETETFLKYYDISSLEVLNSSAASLGPEFQQQAIIDLKSRFKNKKENINTNLVLLQGYGLTESSPTVSLSSTLHFKLGSIGKMICNMKLKILDENNNVITTTNTSGELCFSGPNIMIGYYKNPKATKETVDSDGFLHTGDIGYIDDEGFLYVNDRKKELIKYKGFQVAPAELESILLTSPYIADCAVVGAYQKSMATEVPVAFIVLNEAFRSENVEKTIKHIDSWFSDQVSPHKKLRGGIRIVE
ncbi:hypothetical protein BB558_006904, partial [Smittium angustum]